MNNMTNFLKNKLNSVKNFDADDKILFIIKDIFQADCFENAVSMEQIIEKGIELGLTKDYFTEKWEGYKKGDHTWWLKIAVMAGVGTEEQLFSHEVKHLHRKKIQYTKGQRKANTMVYWYDPTQEHTVVLKKHKVTKKKAEVQKIADKVISESLEEKMQICAANPDKYVMIGNKRISVEWLNNNAEKAKELYGEF